MIIAQEPARVLGLSGTIPGSAARGAIKGIQMPIRRIYMRSSCSPLQVVQGDLIMKNLAIPLVFLLSVGAAPAQAQVGVRIELGLPVAPPLVVIQPGIQVVEGFREEVFFHNGWYWCRRPDGWYRSRSPQARFDWIEARRVPGVLVRVPAGRYRNWHHEGRPGERHVERREERREERRHEERHEERGRHEGEHEHR